MTQGAPNDAGLTNYTRIDTSLANGVDAIIKYDSVTKIDTIIRPGSNFNVGDLLIQGESFPLGGRIYRIDAIGETGDIKQISVLDVGYDGSGPLADLMLDQNSNITLSSIKTTRDSGIGFVLNNGSYANASNGFGGYNYQVGDVLVKGDVNAIPYVDQAILINSVNMNGTVVDLTGVGTGITTKIATAGLNLSQANPPGSNQLTLLRSGGVGLALLSNGTIENRIVPGIATGVPCSGYGYKTGDILAQDKNLFNGNGGAIFKVVSVGMYGEVLSVQTLVTGNNPVVPISLQQTNPAGLSHLTLIRGKGVAAVITNGTIANPLTDGGFGYSVGDLIVQDIVNEEGGATYQVTNVNPTNGSIVSLRIISNGFYRPAQPLGRVMSENLLGLDHFTAFRNFNGFGMGAIITQQISFVQSTNTITSTAIIKVGGIGYKVGQLLVQNQTVAGSGGAVFMVTAIGDVGQIISVKQLYAGISPLVGNNAAIAFDVTNSLTPDTILRAGTGFRVNDIISQDVGPLGAGGRKYRVTQVGATGNILSISVISPGYNGLGPNRSFTLDQNAANGITHISLTDTEVDLVQGSTTPLSELFIYGQAQDSKASLQIGGICSGLVQQQMQVSLVTLRLSGIEFGAANADVIVQGPGNLVIDDCLFNHKNTLSTGDNLSRNYIYVQPGGNNLTVNSSSFLNSNDSAINMYGSGILSINESRFQGNSNWAVEYGSGQFSIDGSSFIANGNVGGVVSINSTVTINNSLFLEQQGSTSIGSALSLSGGRAVVTNSYFGANYSNGNQVNGSKGGSAILALNGANLDVGKSLFVGNRVNNVNDMMRGGGAIYIESGSLQLNQVGFEDNSVSITDYQTFVSQPEPDYVVLPDYQPSPRYSGGGALYAGGQTTINGSWFSGNSVESSVDYWQLDRGKGAPSDAQYSGGGALYLTSATNNSFKNTISNTTFTENQVIQTAIKKDMSRSGQIFFRRNAGNVINMIQQNPFSALTIDMATVDGPFLTTDPYQVDRPVFLNGGGNTDYILSANVVGVAGGFSVLDDGIPDVLYNYNGELRAARGLSGGGFSSNAAGIPTNIGNVTCFDAKDIVAENVLGSPTAYQDLIVGTDKNGGEIHIFKRDQVNINSNRFSELRVGAVQVSLLAPIPFGTSGSTIGFVPKYLKMLSQTSGGATNNLGGSDSSFYAIVVGTQGNTVRVALVLIAQGKTASSGSNPIISDGIASIAVTSSLTIPGSLVDCDFLISNNELVVATVSNVFRVGYSTVSQNIFVAQQLNALYAYASQVIGGVSYGIASSGLNSTDIAITFRDEQMIRYWDRGNINQQASREIDVSVASFGGRPTKIRVGTYLSGLPTFAVGVQNQQNIVLIDFTKDIDSTGRGLAGGAMILADGHNLNSSAAIDKVPFLNGSNQTTLSNVTIVRNSVVNSFALPKNGISGPDSGSVFGDFSLGGATMSNSVNLGNVGLVYGPTSVFRTFVNTSLSGGSLRSSNSNLYDPTSSFGFVGGASGDIVESDSQANYEFFPLQADEVSDLVGLSDLLGGGTPVRYQSGLKAIPISTLSPSIDSGKTLLVTPGSTDGRGLSRVVGSSVDMGAYELQTRTSLSVVSPIMRPAEPLNDLPNQYVLLGYGETTNLSVFCVNTQNEILRGLVTGRVDLIRTSDLAVLGSAVLVPVDMNDSSKGSFASIILNSDFDSIIDSGVNTVYLKYSGDRVNAGSQSAPFDLVSVAARIGVLFSASPKSLIAGNSLLVSGVVDTPASVAALGGSVLITVSHVSGSVIQSVLTVPAAILIDSNDSSAGQFSVLIDGFNFNLLGDYLIDATYVAPAGLQSTFKLSPSDSSPPATIRVVKQPAIALTIPALPLLRTDPLTLKATVTPPITTGFNDPTPLDGKVEFLREDGSVFGTAVLSGTPAFGPVDYILTLANTNSPAFNMPSAPNNLLTARYIPGTNPYLGAVSAPQPLNYITLATTANVALSSGSAVRFYGEPVDVVSTVGGVLASPSPGLSTVELRNNGIAIPGVPALPYIIGQNSYVFSLGLLDPGVYNLASRYSGDGFNYGASTPPVTPLAITINPAATTLGLSWSGSRGVAANGSPLTISVNLGTSSPLSGLATKLSGSVVFYETQIGVPSSKRQVGVPQAIDANGLVAPFTFIPTSTGQFALEAIYTGDSRYAAVSSSIPFTVAAVTLAPIAPTNRPRGEFITLSAAVNPIVDGNLIPATGSVKFVVPSSNGAPDVVIATVPAASATASGVFTTVVDSALAASNLTVGSYNVVAKYVPALGDVFPALSSNSSGLVIERQNVVLTASVSSNATSYGDQITVQCQIDPAVPGTTLPFGANSFITLYDGSQGLVVLPFTDGQRSVSFVTSGLSAGVHTLQFVYGGDANYQAALSSRMTVTVARSTATISLSTSASVVALGGTVSLTTRVTPPANYPPVGPLGTVTFKANNQIIGVDNVAADGTSRFSYTPSETGNFVIEAVYSGSQQYPSTSAVAAVTSYAFSMAPINPVGGVLGDVVSLKATLSSYDTDIRQAGSVDFVLANGTVLASVPTSAATNAPNGREFFVNINSGLLASRLRVGTISVQAVYNSTGLLGVYPRAYSQVRTFTLSAQPTLLVATPPAAPIVLGASSVISASVSPSIVATDFPFGVGNVILYEGSTILQTKSVTDAMRTVTFSTASLSVGRHVLSLQYTGDGLNYQGSRSTTFAINIAKVDPDVSVVSSKSVTALGQSTLVTATIGGSVASTGAKPSGVVQFMQGTVVLGSAVLFNGKAALNFAPKRVETASITAKYLGDANFDTDTSNVNVVSVGRAPYMVVAAQGGATIKTFDAKTKAQIASFQPLGAAYAGGFRVAKGDVNGDNVPDFVVTPNTGSVVRVYDGQSQKLAGSFTSFANSFALPVSLAIADINGDGRGDIIVAPGGVVLNPQVRVFSGNGYQLLKSMPAFAPGYKGAVSLAVGDVDGDGRADIVCAPASGSSAAISIFSGVTGLALASFADIKTPVGGASVAVGDLTGDGKAEIVLAALSGSSRVTVYDGASRTVLSSFQAFGTVTSGARVTFGTDLNLDGQPELVVGSGFGGNSQVRRFNALNGQLVDAFFAFAAGSKERNGGLFVA